MVKKRIITAFIITTILLIIIIAIVKSSSIKRVSLNTIYTVIKDSDFTLVFSGDYTDDISNELKQYRDKYGFNIFVCTDEREEVEQYLYETTDMEDELVGNLYLVYDKTGIIGYIDGTMNTEEYIKKYTSDYLPVAERRYNQPSADELKELYNSKKTSIIVLGNDSCNFCSKLEKVINSVVINKELEINYINFSRITEAEANKIYNLDLVVPAQCNISGIATNIKDGYAKPMTLITKKGKVIGCIKGYYDYTTYYNKLREIME